MTDEDRALLNALTDACAKFSLNLSMTRFTREDHIEMALMFLHLADRMLKRLIDTSTVTGDHSA